MSEPMYLQGDSVALAQNKGATNYEHECECGAENSVLVEYDYHLATREVTYWGEYVCPKCKVTNTIEDWDNI